MSDHIRSVCKTYGASCAFGDSFGAGSQHHPLLGLHMPVLWVHAVKQELSKLAWITCSRPFMPCILCVEGQLALL